MSKSKESLLRLIKSGLSVCFVILLISGHDLSAKPKDMNWIQELKFNPRKFYSVEYNVIKDSGYRTQELDTSKRDIGVLIYNDCKYYNKIFGFNVEKANFIICNDTIIKLTLIFDIQSSKAIANLKKFNKKLNDIYKIESFSYKDEETCGENYKLMLSYILRDDIVNVYYPIDINETYMKIEIRFNVELGRKWENEHK